ncbi:MAG: TolC family protein [Cyanobacteria bacterium SIG26]|nr:TolC family protein [Cyanobacteria bacterium SIG26]
MNKKIFILILFCLSIDYTCYAESGNKLNPFEFPNSNQVLPTTNTDAQYIISGSVEKNIDITLDNCIKIALGNNPQINAAFQDILAADARIKQVWSNYFPTFSWQTGYTRLRQLQLSDALGENLEFNYFLLGQISLQQMLYDFGVTQNQATIRKLDYESYKKSFEAIVNNVIYQTKDAYFNLLYTYENKRVAQDTVRKFELFYNQAKAFYKSGMNPKVDVTIAETNLSNAKLKLIQADNAINLAKARLNNIMGVPYLEKYNPCDKLEFMPINITFDESIAIARESRPELKQAEIKVETANQTLKLAKKSFLPTLSFESQFQRGGKSWDSNYGFNIGGYLTFPTINTMLVKNEIKEARFLYDKELANAINTQNNIYLEIQNAYLTLAEKRNQLPVSIIQVKQAKENYDLSYGRYRVGEGSPTELKDAENTYEQAQLTYYTSLYQYNSAKAELERAIGKNLVSCDNEVFLEK